MIPSKPKMQLVTLAIFSLLLSGCAVSTGQNQEMAFGHVHGIVDLGSGKMLMGTHTGIYSLNSSGEIAGPIGGNDFDAMGITGNSRVQYASGHPGPNTPSELGSPNLGVVQSVNAGKAWSPEKGRSGRPLNDRGVKSVRLSYLSRHAFPTALLASRMM